MCQSRYIFHAGSLTLDVDNHGGQITLQPISVPLPPAFRRDHNIPDDFLLPIEYHALFSAIHPGNRHELVDLSTRYYPELARFHNKQWELPLPEPYTWQWDAPRAGAHFAENVEYGLLVHEMVANAPEAPDLCTRAMEIIADRLEVEAAEARMGETDVRALWRRFFGG